MCLGQKRMVDNNQGRSVMYKSTDRLSETAAHQLRFRAQQDSWAPCLVVISVDVVKSTSPQCNTRPRTNQSVPDERQNNHREQ
mmetsp:Transcript_6991/g.15991  ORF Transcript_6991/g.15991 Transcript_6991/m.15991 type:complete len:83 (-) Transcript_6991:1285-1533(-)